VARLNVENPEVASPNASTAKPEIECGFERIQAATGLEMERRESHSLGRENGMTEKSTAVQTAQGQTLLKTAGPQMIADRVNEVYQKIARRAFEHFERHDGIWGHDRDHWFAAETEPLHPVHINIAELDEALTLQAEVPGFGINELQISLEPKRLTITGKKGSSGEQKRGNTIYEELCSNEILRVVDLPLEVEASKATATLKNGVLELKMPKAANSMQQSRAAVTAA
jgi:HSP20 family molecular chaperone IbpA